MGPRILIVDDNLDLTTLLAEVLAARGFRVRVAEDGEQGLEMLHRELPDAVLLDVEMPHLTGPELAYRMFIHDAGMEEVPIVLSSGVARLDDVARIVGTPYFLSKPFEIHALLALLQRALEEQTAPQPAPRV